MPGRDPGRNPNPCAGKWQSIAELPGFDRGLSIFGPNAIIGLSKSREKSATTGVLLAERRDQLKCGVAWWTINAVTWLCFKQIAHTRPRD